MSKKLEDGLNNRIDIEIRKMYEAINKTYPNSITPFNEKFDKELDQSFAAMVKDSVRMSLWLKDE